MDIARNANDIVARHLAGAVPRGGRKYSASTMPMSSEPFRRIYPGLKWGKICRYPVEK